VIVNGSSGNDSYTLVVEGGQVVAKNPAAASVSIAHAEAFNDKLTINTLGGDDLIDASPVVAGQIAVAIEGGGGNDTLRVTGVATDDFFNVFANSGRANVIGNGGLLLDADGIERIEIRALAGPDTIFVSDMASTLVREVDVDLAATPGGSAADNKADSITVTNGITGTALITNIGNKMVIQNSVTLETVTVDHWDKNDVLLLSDSGGVDIFDATKLAAGKMALHLLGGLGDDQISTGAANDTISGGDGNDHISMGDGNDTVTWAFIDDDDVVDGGAGNDTARFDGSTDGELFSLSASADHVAFTYGFGAAHADLDNVERVEIFGFTNTDLYFIGDLTGTDVKQLAFLLGTGGGAGDGFTDSVGLSGTAKNDSISLSQSAAGITINGLAAQVTITDAEAQDVLQINGGAGNDSINFGALKAGTFTLTLNGDEGKDTLTGGLGNDTLFGDSESDTLKGGAGNDSLFGGSDNDSLDGGAGDDILAGGGGNDSITGGAGNDTIRYSSQNDGHDTVSSFDGNATGGQDVVDLDLLFDNLLVATVDRAGRISIDDNGSTVEISIDADGNSSNGFELSALTLKTVDVIAVGEDIQLGTL